MPMLIESGINPPGVLEFFYKLSERNIYDETLPLTVEEGTQILGQIVENLQKAN